MGRNVYMRERLLPGLLHKRASLFPAAASESGAAADDDAFATQRTGVALFH